MSGITNFTVVGTVVARDYRAAANTDITSVFLQTERVDNTGIQRVERHEVKLFGRGKAFHDSLVKGKRAIASGRISSRDWEYEGQPRHSMELVALSFAIMEDEAPPAVAPAAKPKAKAKATTEEVPF